MNSSAESWIGSSVTRLVVHRVAIMAPTLLGVTVLLCAIAHLTPGMPAAQPDLFDTSQQSALTDWQRERFGYDQPFVKRYGLWMSRIVGSEERGVLPLGESSMTGRSVRAELAGRLPVTMLLSGLSLLLALSVAIPAGLVMALRAGGALDRAIFGVLLTLWSVPMVVMATLLLAFLTRGGQGAQWFPTSITASESGAGALLVRLVLPAVSLAIVACAPLARQVRAALIEQLGQDYVQTAMAKGLSRAAVVRRHVVRASLVPLVAVLALLVPRLIAGSVLIETVFSIDGMGLLAWRSAVNRDLDVVLMIALLTAIAHMVSLLLADVLALWLDPRIRLGRAKRKAVQR